MSNKQKNLKEFAKRNKRGIITLIISCILAATGAGVALAPVATEVVCEASGGC